MWSIQNITRVALMQVGVVIASILVGGVYHKFSSMSEPPSHMPAYQNWWYQHGLFGFCLPIFWGVIALYLHSRDVIDDSIKLFIFWFGVIAVVALAFLVVNSILKIFLPEIHTM